MSPVLIAAAVLASGLQKPPPNNVAFPDVSDNHFVYATLSDLRAGGLLPELDPDELLSATHPLTRGKIGQYVVEATINLQRFVDQHRQINATGNTVKYSDTVSTLTGNQITYLVALTPRIRRVAKTIAPNLPPFVHWAELDHTLDAETKLIDGLLAGE